MRFLLVCGIPGAGKSHFGKWLEANHGFVHLDVEKDGHLAAHGLTEAWKLCFASLDVGPFARSLPRLGNRVVVNWGFPPRFLKVVQRFKAAGLVPWWFDADHVAARRAFIARGDVPIQYFEIQIAAIRQQWTNIDATFRPNIIPTLEADGSRLSPDAIYKLIREAERDDSEGVK